MPVTRQKVCVGGWCGAVGGCKPILVFRLGQAEQFWILVYYNPLTLLHGPAPAIYM